MDEKKNNKLSNIEGSDNTEDKDKIKKENKDIKDNIKKQEKTDKADEADESDENTLDCMNDTLASIREKFVDINIIREELTKLKLDPAKKTFFEYNIEPLLKIFDSLSLASQNYGLAISSINVVNLSKSSEIKQILQLLYDITDKSEDVFKVLEKEIDIILDIYKCDLKRMGRK